MKSSSSLQVGGVVGEEDDDGRGFRVLQRIRRRNECWSRHGRRRPPFRYRQGYSFYNIPISIFCFVTTSVFRPITCSCGFCLITDALVGIKTISCFSFYHWIGILMLPLLGGKDWLIDWFFVGCFVSLCQVKLQKHNTDVEGLRYKNGLHCASRILQTEGVCFPFTLLLCYVSLLTILKTDVALESLDFYASVSANLQDPSSP